MAAKPRPVTLRSRYAEQAVADLEENRRRQAELLSHLEVLRQEETLLLDIIDLAGKPPTRQGSGPAPARYEATGDVSEPGGPTSHEPSPRASAATDPAPHAGTGGKSSGRQPLLRDLLLDLLRAHREPRPAKEVWRDCLRKHPDRSPSNQVVRNTLEGLVAEGRVERHKQGHAVTYAIVESTRGE